MTVLVLAAETDRTADSVVTGLTERKVPVMRVDMSWFPQHMSLDAEFRGGRCRGVLRTAHHEVDLAEIRSVWVRTPSTYAFPDALSVAERDFARREAKVGVGGALLSLPGVLWATVPTWPPLRCIGRCNGPWPPDAGWRSRERWSPTTRTRWNDSRRNPATASSSNR